MSNLSELIERIEGAGEGSLDLDRMILGQLGYTWRGMAYWKGYGTNCEMWTASPLLTRSLDAAMTLVPQGWIVEIRRSFNGDGEYFSQVALTNSFTVGRGCEPDEAVSVSSHLVERKQGEDPTPRAIVAAALRARQQEKQP